MLAFIKRIIQHMLEVYKRALQVFFPLFGLFLLGAVQTYIFMEDYRIPVTIILLILAMISLIIATITFIYHIKDARRNDKEVKKESDYKALVEAFMRTGMTKEQAEIAARGH